MWFSYKGFRFIVPAGLTSADARAPSFLLGTGTGATSSVFAWNILVDCKYLVAEGRKDWLEGRGLSLLQRTSSGFWNPPILLLVLAWDLPSPILGHGPRRGSAPA